MDASTLVAFVCPQELQKAYDKRKPIVLSINLCSNEFVQTDSAESRELQAKLKDMNNHWDKMGSSLEEWRRALQEALMQCQVEFRGKKEDKMSEVSADPFPVSLIPF